MKLTIIGATGGIGRLLLQQAAAAGHDVTAVVRNPGKLPPELPVTVATTDLAAPDPAVLEAAIKGADAVLSGLGAVSAAQAGVATGGTRAVLAAMRATGVSRIVVVSAAPIGTVPSPERPDPPKHDPGDGFFMRHLFSHIATAAFRTHYADLAAMEDVLRASGLDWTISRPPKLTDGPLTGSYSTALGRNVKGGWSISRADVAHQMLHALDQSETIGQTVGMAGRPARQRP
jgi:putative NADH-flavin reductase